MSQPVKLSDALVLDARLAAEAQERSIAGQVEFWAKLGQSVEMLLRGGQVMALRKNAEIMPLSEALSSVDSPAGRKRLQEVLASRPYPHFRQHPGDTSLLIRIDEDGTRTAGRFVNRSFVAAESGRLKPGKQVKGGLSVSSRKRSIHRGGGKAIAALKHTGTVAETTEQEASN